MMSPIRIMGPCSGDRETGMSKRGVTKKRPTSGRPKASAKEEGKEKGKGKVKEEDGGRAAPLTSTKPLTPLDKSILSLEDLSPGQKAVLLAIPIRNEKGVTWKENGDATVTLRYKKNFGRFERWLFTKVGGAEYLNVPLDEIGSYLWLGCDGRHTVAQLCMGADARFKERVEPVVPRVIKFFEILLRRHLITLARRDVDEDSEDQR
jgi:hypothetical protein